MTASFSAALLLGDQWTAPKTRRQTVVRLLETLADVLEESPAMQAGGAAPDSRLLRLPAEYWQGSYRQLETMRVLLRLEAPELARHLAGRYFHVSRVVKTVRRDQQGSWLECLGHDPRGCGNGRHRRLPAQLELALRRAERGPKGKISARRRLIEHWPVWVDEQKAGRAVDWIAANWRGREPRLPGDVKAA